MIHLFINSLAASAGGGLTYIRNLLPHLAGRTDLRVTATLPSSIRSEFQALRNIDILELDFPASRRFWYEQSMLPDVIRRSQADVLLSAGNFAIRRSPIPQILLSRNSIYTSADFYRDLRSRHEYHAWLDTRLRAELARRSIRWAHLTVAPSEAFADELRRWTGRRVLAVHHGFDPEYFVHDSTAVSAAVEKKLRAAEGSLKLLFVSHYNYYRNFETLVRALPLLAKQITDRPIKLLLTCRLAPGLNPGRYRPQMTARLIQELGVSEMVVELGAIPYSHLHHLYGRADIYVTPAYAETFAHPLVEAMASGLPVVASDLSVHREICGEAAQYFPRFSPEGLARCVAQVAQTEGSSKQMVALGRERSLQFSWSRHAQKLIDLAGQLVAAQSGASSADEMAGNTTEQAGRLAV